MSSIPDSFSSLHIFLLLAFLPWQLDSLYCHQCLAISCPATSDPKLCNSARDYIVQQLRDAYYIGDYLQPCPEPDDGIAWRTMELSNEKTCEQENNGWATCTLGRLELKSSNNETESRSDDNVLTHATVLGCARTSLIREMAKAKVGNNCSYTESVNYGLGGRRRGKPGDPYLHKLEIEHCPNLSDYCKVDYCVTSTASVVKAFKPQDPDTSFEYGTVITIIVVIVVILLVVIAAAMCTNPMGHATNYSPAQAQEQEISTAASTSVRSLDASI